MIKRFIGGLLIFFVFGALFTSFVAKDGLIVAATEWAIALGFMLILWLGVCLIID